MCKRRARYVFIPPSQEDTTCMHVDEGEEKTALAVSPQWACDYCRRDNSDSSKKILGAKRHKFSQRIADGVNKGTTGMPVGLFFIGIIFVWLFLWGQKSPVLALEPDLWAIPQLPESEVVWKDKLLEVNGIGAASTRLKSNLSAKEIVDFYTGTLTNLGWEVNKHYVEQDTLVFSKEGKYVYVTVPYNGDRSPRDVYIATSPQDLRICMSIHKYLLKEEIAGDAPGRDFQDLPRYPGAKRRLNVFTPMSAAALMYEVEARPKDVARFYREKLRAEGWKEERALGQRAMEKVMSRVKGLNEEVAILLFYRKNDSLLINVATVPKPSCTSPNMLKRSLVIVARNMEREMPKLEKKELQKELRSRKGGKL